MKMELDLSPWRKIKCEKMNSCLPYCYICSLNIIFRKSYVTDFYPESTPFIFVFMIWTKKQREGFLHLRMPTVCVFGGDNSNIPEDRSRTEKVMDILEK